MTSSANHTATNAQPAGGGRVSSGAQSADDGTPAIAQPAGASGLSSGARPTGGDEFSASVQSVGDGISASVQPIGDGISASVQSVGDNSSSGAQSTAGERLRLHVLGSGSKGNCALVEGPCGLIMIDDGFSRREVLRRMHELGLSEDDVRALILTHEHSDHVSGVSVWCKRFSGELYASAGTAEARSYLANLPFQTFCPGDELTIAGVRVRTFATSHDVVNPVGFRFQCGADTIGYATDTGTLSAEALEALADVRVLALESNHDIPMLRCGSYPRVLQDRIASDRGHLSNEQAADALRQVLGPRTEHVLAMHISQENNRPSLAVRALAAAVGAELDNELGSSATLTRGNNEPALRIRPAGQLRPFSV